MVPKMSFAHPGPLDCFFIMLRGRRDNIKPTAPPLNLICRIMCGRARIHGYLKSPKETAVGNHVPKGDNLQLRDLNISNENTEKNFSTGSRSQLLCALRDRGLEFVEL